MGDRVTRSGIAVCTVASLVLFAVLDARAESRIAYRRATPLDVRMGIVRIRVVDEVIVDVPTDCPATGTESLACRQERRFPRVYILDFSLERREARDTGVHIETEDRGRVSLFLHFDPAARQSFDDELRLALARLAADAFAESFAGLQPDGGVFSGIAPRSAEPSWSCFERGPSRQAGRYERYVERGEDGALHVTGSGWSGYREDQVTAALCKAGATVAQSLVPDEIRTMPVVRAILETTVRVSYLDGLQHPTPAEELTPWPPHLEYTVERDPGVTRSESVRKTAELVRASFTTDEVKVTASASAAQLAPGSVTTNSWVARWTLEIFERQMGPLPAEELVHQSDLLTAFFPTLPPARLDDRGAPVASEPVDTYDVGVDAEGLVTDVANRLDAAATIDVQSVEEAVASHPVGLKGSGWLLAICRSDGSADYRPLPTMAVGSVQNAAVLCAAVEHQLATVDVE